jgi:hypothetical protein
MLSRKPSGRGPAHRMMCCSRSRRVSPASGHSAAVGDLRMTKPTGASPFPRIPRGIFRDLGGHGDIVAQAALSKPRHGGNPGNNVATLFTPCRQVCFNRTIQLSAWRAADITQENVWACPAICRNPLRRERAAFPHRKSLSEAASGRPGGADPDIAFHTDLNARSPGFPDQVH